MANEGRFQPDWAKPQNWPVRRRAPGYPKRWTTPSSVVGGIFLPLVVYSFACGPKYLGWSVVGALALALFVVYQRTLNRFDCPQCGKRLPLTWPKPREFVRFHCKTCNVVWLTGVQAPDDDTGAGGGDGI